MLLPAYGWLLLGVLLPLLSMLALSLAPSSSRPAQALTLDHYLALGRRPYLLELAWRSLSLGLWTTGLCIAIGLPAALALTRSVAGPVRRVLFLLLILPFFSNGLVRVFSWSIVLRDGGILDRLGHVLIPSAPPLGILYSTPAVVVGLVHAYLPYMILTCYLSLQTIEHELIEAAQSLGARAHVVLWKILLPLAMPGILAGAVLIFVPVLGSFMEPRLLGGKSGAVFGIAIEEQFTQGLNWPLGSALSFTLLAFVVVLFVASSKVLRRRVLSA